MRKLILTFNLVVTFFHAFTQSNKFEWAKSIGGDVQDAGTDIKTDKAGNVYTTGFFQHTADFDPGPGVFNLKVNSSNNNLYNNFISKLDSNGNFQWAKQFDCGNSVFLDLDTLGNLYIIGNYGGTVDFDPGPGIFQLYSPFALFILKLNPLGNFQWVKSINALEARSISLDPIGNIYACGQYGGTVDFDPDTGVYNITSTSNSDIFMAKFSPDGKFRWAKGINGNDYQVPYSLAIDLYGNIYTTGIFRGAVDFDPSNLVYNISSVNSSIDGFICKLDSSGNFLWAKQIGWTLNDFFYSIFTDLIGNVYTTGGFNGTVDFDPGIGVYSLSSSGKNDAFILKLDGSGNFIWTTKIGGTNSDVARSIMVDGLGNAFSVGEFEGEVDFDPSVDSFKLSSTNQFTDIFVLKIDSSGNFIWAKKFGGIGSDYVTRIHLDSKGNIYSTGSYRLTADFNPGFGTFNQTSVGFEDIFILKLGNCQPTFSSLTTTSCKSYSIGNRTYTKSGLYSLIIENFSGCDSIVNLNLTIKSVNDSVTQTGNVLTAKAISAIYQWVECPLFNILNGENGQSFMAKSNSDYAVIITQNGCTDTSDCFNITTAGIDDIISPSMGISPNPNNGLFNVDILGASINSYIEILNSFGEIVYSKNTTKSQNTINLSNRPNGLYFIKVIDNNIQVLSGRILKIN